MSLAPFSKPLLELRDRGLVPPYLRVSSGWNVAPRSFPVGYGIVIPLDADLEAQDLRVVAGLDCVMLFELKHEEFARSVFDLLNTRYLAGRVFGLPTPYLQEAIITDYGAT